MLSANYSMASVISLQLQSDTNLRPGRIGILTYLASFFLMSGGLFQAYLGFAGNAVVFGLRGGTLEGLGVVGILDPLVLMGLGVVATYRPKPGILSGLVILLVAVSGLVTSFIGFFLAGTVTGLILGVMVINQGRRLSGPSAGSSSQASSEHP